MNDVVVIGAGLSGLAAAHRVLELDAGARVTVLEASERVGGLLGTIEQEEFVIETGPDSILTEKPAALALASRLGLSGRVIGTRSEHRGAYVVCRGRLEPVPEGFSLMAPTRALELLRSPVLSPRGRLRALAEPLVPKGNGGDESMASFVRRRFGVELFERLAQPLVGGIYGGDPERLSLSATMPRFVRFEEEHGSVIRGMLASQRRASERAAGGARYGLFAAFDRGMQVLIDALAERLGDRVRLRAKVAALEPGYRVVLESGEAISTARVMLAIPAWAAARLLGPISASLQALLGGIAYGSAALVTFAWPRDTIPHPLDAFGFVVPTVERRRILAGTFASVKWPGRAPAGQELVRVFVGGEHAKDACELDDAALVALARRELGSLLGIRSEPRFSLVRRAARAMPHYHVGHANRVRAVEQALAAVPRLGLASNALYGVGIPDTIAAAERAAERLLASPRAQAS